MSALRKIISDRSNWNIKKILAVHALLGLLLLSWFFYLTHPTWEFLDSSFYRFVNGFIEKSSFWQHFWAFSNHNMTDWFHDIVVLVFFAFYLSKKTEKSLPEKISELLFFIIVIGFTILLINRLLCLEILQIHRKSPSLVFDFATKLSEKVSIIKIKGWSYSSYPGDHGTTAIMFGFVITHLMGRKPGFLAFLYSTYWIAPRLVTGCHWLTDVIMGSLVIGASVMSLTIYTPFKKSFIYLVSPLFQRKFYTRKEQLDEEPS